MGSHSGPPISKSHMQSGVCYREGVACSCVQVDPPTLVMTFAPNDSPVFGREGKKLTSELIRARLELECENNVPSP